MCRIIAGCILIAVMLSAACSNKLEVKPAPVQQAKSKPLQEPRTADEKLPWQSEWDKTLSMAKKERQLKVYTSLEPSVIRPLLENFKSKFGIEGESLAGRGPEVIPKMFAERRAGLFTVDVYIGGTDPILYMLKPAGALVPLKTQLFLPEVLDPKLWYKDTLPWVDKEQSFILQTKGGPEPGELVLNTTLIKKGELTSYHDLLQPKYRGKLNLTDPTISGRGNKWFGAVLFFKSLDLDYMKALAGQELMLTRDKRLQIDWVAKGKHLVAMLPNSPQYREFLDAGAPLDYIRVKESKLVLGGGSSGVSLVENQPHPQAARLFLNWFLSKEGQTIFSRVFSYQSFRVDVPVDHLPSDQVRAPDVDYPVESEAFLEFVSRASQQAKDIFGPFLR